MRSLLAEIVTSKRNRSIAILAALWCAIAVVLWLVREVLFPFVLAIFLAYLLAPMVRWLRSYKLRGRSVSPVFATLVIYIAFTSALVGLLRLTLPVVARELARTSRMTSQIFDELRAQAPSWPAMVEDVLDDYGIPVHFVWGAAPITTAQAPASQPTPASHPAISGAIEMNPEAINLPGRSKTYAIDLKKELSGYITGVTEYVSAGVSTAVSQAQNIIRNLFTFVFRTFLVLMVCAFILADPERIKSFLFSMVPTGDQQTFDGLLGRIDHGLSGVVRGQILICLANGLFTLLGLLILKVPLPFILAGLATVLSLVPIFGSIISSVPIVAVALSQSLGLALGALLWIIIIHLVEANLLNPKIMGDAAKIHPVVVVLSLIVGEHFYGIVGALFAVPIASILLTVFKFSLQRAIELQREHHHEGDKPATAVGTGSGAP